MAAVVFSLSLSLCLLQPCFALLVRSWLRRMEVDSAVGEHFEQQVADKPTPTRGEMIAAHYSAILWRRHNCASARLSRPFEL